ncbi:MAG: epoxyqueuosine reductase [Candidatus Heimdallarchaeota archaeon]|nr:epoxyqueuosine reductase [Candidatus Heimdallarchaeota archaeon]MBY8993306.1 epoxyqueuosine reductase [Candidatus Heimdallarchaeota archaeon]
MKEKESFMQKMQKRVFGSSKHLAKYPNTIKAKETALVMGFERKLKIKNSRKLFVSRLKMFGGKTAFSLLRQTKKATKTLKKNPQEPKNTASDDFFKKLEEYAESIDVKVGYAKLTQDLIFKNHAVLFDNAIVLSMEMNKEKIDKAPSLATGKMVIRTYDELGIRANKIAEFVKKEGFAAEACHPLGGPIGFVPLALSAGMGWVGRHGLLITPDYGPRHRLAAVLTNITNIPILNENPHQWVGEYCSTCGRCIETCPGEAILETSISNEDGRKTHIIFDKCFQVFAEEYGCSVCVKECMFNRVGYDKLKAIVEKKQR